VLPLLLPLPPPLPLLETPGTHCQPGAEHLPWQATPAQSTSTYPESHRQPPKPSHALFAGQ
jgi:hypothetical protein